MVLETLLITMRAVNFRAGSIHNFAGLNLNRARGEIPRWISRSNGGLSWLYAISNLWYPLFKDSVWSSQDKLVSLLDFEERYLFTWLDISRKLFICIKCVSNFAIILYYFLYLMTRYFHNTCNYELKIL